MRILVISNTPFLPASAGNRARIGQMVAHLGRSGAEVAMVMLPAGDRATWDEAGMRAQLAHFEVVRAPVTARARGWLDHQLASPVSAHTRPIGIDEWCPRWYRRRVAEFARIWQPDAAIVEYVFLSGCLDDVRRVAPGVLGVVDTLDVMSRRHEVYESAGLTPRWFHTTLEEERRGLGRADLVVAIQEGEAEIFRRMSPDREVLTVPHAHPVEPAPLGEAAPSRLLLVASYNDLNVEGLRWLVERVWPALRSAVPDVELAVCGTIHEKVREVPAGILVLGVVPSLAQEYARARIVVNPVPSATGVQVKVVEALCHGRPVVSTRAGATGLEQAGGVTVADAPETFAAAVRGLLADGALWQRAAAEGAAYARRHLSPDAAFRPLVERLLDATYVARSRR